MSTKAKRPRLSVVSAPAEEVTSEDLDMRQIEIDLADAEYCANENVSIPTAEEVFLEIEDLLEELVHTASKTQASTVSHLCFLLSDYFPGLQAVSELADSAV